MFIGSSRRWTAGTEQRASGTFLLLCLPKTAAEPTEKQCPYFECSGVLKGWHGKLVICGGCGRESYMPSFSPKFTDLRAFVKHVRLRQSGHWMVGSMEIHGEKVLLSGTYGSDGLPTDVERLTWERGLPLPPDLIERYRTATGGHNCAGSEGQPVHDWAVENLKALRAASRSRKEVTSAEAK